MRATRGRHASARALLRSKAAKWAQKQGVQRYLASALRAGGCCVLRAALAACPHGNTRHAAGHRCLGQRV